ncbi:hypothetical protein WME91_25855 [Sorangium sp. So ce269]
MKPKEIVCLANSTKTNGRCIAGREYSASKVGGWVRPVSARPTHEISTFESTYHHDGGGQPAVLDIVRVPLVAHAPLAHQTENYMIDPQYSWERVDRISWKDVLKLVEKPTSLWGMGEGSFHGINDEVSPAQAQASGISNSLVLLRPKTVTVLVRDESRYTGGSDRRARVEFEINGIQYRLALTDPDRESHYLSHGPGEYDVSGSIICASLTEFFTKKNGVTHAFKLAAALIEEEP